VTFTVVYDADVLYPSCLRDLLIRVAQAGLVQAKWTDHILDTTASRIPAAPTPRTRPFPPTLGP
jgi:hypothetical protein